MAAMMPPERVRRQSSRLSWPGGSIRTSMTATATIRILAQLHCMSREQTVAGSIQVITSHSSALATAAMLFNLQLERCDHFRPAETILLRKGDEFIETHAPNFDAHVFHALDKSIARQ